MFTTEEKWAITLSTFAGLSTTIGAAIAVSSMFHILCYGFITTWAIKKLLSCHSRLLQVISRPDDSLLAFLLGTAIGVMLVLSVMEMWLHNAMENGWASVTAAVMCGALLYQLAQPFLPDFQPAELASTSDGAPGPNTSADDQDIATTAASTSGRPPLARQASGSVSAAIKSGRTRRGEQSSNPRETEASPAAKGTKSRMRSPELLRLGLLMAFTMTLHNLPEGFAVGFSALTDFGPIMATAIAVHNIPEGVIIAAPVFAATGSRWKALAIATLSGLSEPLGATIALVALKPFLTAERLQYMLAFVGGIMGAVCVLELWPEGRKCRDDRRLVAGVVIGGAIMGWTLWVGV